MNAKINKSELKKAALQCDASQYLSFREYLSDIYLELKKIDPDYTYVKYSDHVGLGLCTAMNLIVNGKRPLTLKSAKKIASALGITHTQRYHFLKLVELENPRAFENRREALEMLVDNKLSSLPTDLEKKQLEFYKNWYNAAIFEILAIDNASDDPEWIAQTIMPRVPVKKVVESLQLLRSLNMITYDYQKKRLVPVQQHYTTGPQVRGLAVLTYHQQAIELGKNSLFDIVPTERDITALTLATSAETRDKIIAYIARAREEIVQLACQDSAKNIVIQLNFQLFPLTKTKKKEKK
jgi:uncharacterized protein (TIGR02147 family)